MRLRTSPISDHWGAVVLDLDVRSIDDDIAGAIAGLLSEHLALVFPGQDLEPHDQKRFACRFGAIQDRPDVSTEAPEAERHFMVIGNRPAEGQAGVVGDGEMSLHFDQSYKPRPVGLGFLYGLEVHLLAELVAHVEAPRFGHDHSWSVGDLLVWDNLALLHGRRHFDPAEPRVLRRVSVRGVPFEAPNRPELSAAR